MIVEREAVLTAGCEVLDNWTQTLTDDIAIFYGQAGRIMYHNEKFTDLFGYSLPEPFTAFDLVPPDQQLIVASKLANPATRAYTITCRDKSGRLFDARVNVVLVGELLLASLRKI